MLTLSAALRLLRCIGLTLAVQLAMMSAYVAAAATISPATPLTDLIAASALVIFAASVPVSLAGWGIREMSAIVALGAIGVATGEALVVAVLIGALSLSVMAALALVSIHSWIATPRPSCAIERHTSIDFMTALAWGVPLAVASLVLFQVHVPAAAGKLNVNLADPFAILGGALFLLSSGGLPRWRLPWLNGALLAATGALSLSLLIGAIDFGWTAWAVVNKWLGWFVLLAYAATGALIMQRASGDGFRLLLATYAAAAMAVAAVDIGLVGAKAIGFPTPLAVLGSRISGFSQNPNAFSFQMMIALVTIIVISASERVRTIQMATILAALWFSSSRAAWITLPIVLGLAVWTARLPMRSLASSAQLATGIVVGIWILPWLLSGSAALVPVPVEFSAPTSTTERIRTMLDAWNLFLSHPLFGAGLGSYVNSELSANGVPLVIHSTPLWLLAEMGLVGLGAFAIPAVRIVAQEWRQSGAASQTIILALVAFGLMSLVHELFYQRTLWLVLGAALALPMRRGRPSGRRVICR